jgi:hypothetical protein
MMIMSHVTPVSALSRTLVWAAISLLLVASAEGAEPIAHPFSGFVFPPRVASFHREEVTRFDKEGKDLGVGYNDLTTPASHHDLRLSGTGFVLAGVASEAL